jgi:attractin
VVVEIENKEYNEISPAIENITNISKKRKKVSFQKKYTTVQNTNYFTVFQDSPSPIALEPCEGNKAAVLSLLVRLPTGKFQLKFTIF